DYMNVFFFFQAEDGIRGFHVTGVQTCALPILPTETSSTSSSQTLSSILAVTSHLNQSPTGISVEIRTTKGETPSESVKKPASARSEERRVGKEKRLERRSKQKNVRKISNIQNR